MIIAQSSRHCQEMTTASVERARLEYRQKLQDSLTQMLQVFRDKID